MNKLKLTIMLFFCIGYYANAQFDRDSDGFYDNCNSIGSGDYLWNYYIPPAGSGGGSISQSVTSGAVVHTCTNIYSGTQSVSVIGFRLSTSINFSNAAHQVVKIRMKSTIPITLAMQLSEDGSNFKLDWNNLPTISLPGDNQFNDYTINYTGNIAVGANLAIVQKIDFYYQGTTPISPAIQVDYIEAGDPPMLACFERNAFGAMEGGCVLSNSNYSWSASTPSGTGNISIEATGGDIVSNSTGIIATSNFPSVAIFNLNTTIDLSSGECNQKAWVRLKSSSAITLNFQLENTVGTAQLSGNGPSISLPGDNTYHEYFIDFSTLWIGGAEKFNIRKARFAYHGNTAVSTTISIDQFSIGSYTNIYSSEPTTNPSVSISEVTLTSLKVSWSGGNGVRRLVAITALGTIAPVDGVQYTGNSQYGHGSALGSLEYVVYDGTGNTVTVTNLDPNENYTIRVYEYNGSGCGTNYKTTSPGSASRPILAAEPTVPASNMVFSSVTNTTMTVSWTNGNGSNRLLIGRQGSPISVLPTDFNTNPYTAVSFFGASSADLGGGNYILYNGTGSSANISGLTSGVTYYFAVIEYNINFGNQYSTNYATGTHLSGNQTTTGTVGEPMTAANTITFTNVNANSFTINWINGNGSNRLVLVKQGSAVNSVPIDNNGYTANTLFGTGSQLGTGNYVVYSSNGNSVTVTGLTASTTYHVAVFEYNGSGSTANYKTNSYPTANRTTSATVSEPTTAASSVAFSNVTSSGFTLSWTNGNGSGRLVLIKQASPVNSSPVDNVTYTANAQYGSGTQIGSGNFVAYAGTGNSVNITGMAPNTDYYIRIFEYNGTAGSENYLTSAYAEGMQKTDIVLSFEPTQPASSITFSSVTANSFTINWSNGNGSGRLVLVKSGSAVNSLPVDYNTYTANSVFSSGAQLGTGNYAVYSGSGNSVTLTGLSASTTYHVAIFEYAGSGSETNYLTSTYPTANQTTNAATASEPTIAASGLSFSSVTSSSMTLTWTNGNGSSRMVIVKSASAVNGLPVDNNSYTANAQFGSGTQIGTGNYVVYSGTGNSVSITGLSASTAYHFAVVEFNGSGVTSNYLTSTYPTANQTTNAATASEPTVAASGLSFSSVTSSSMTLTWTNGNGSNRMVIVKSASAVNGLPVDNNSYTANAQFGSGTQIGTGNYVVYSGTGNSVSITGLSASTAYHFAVVEFNGSGVTSNYLTSTYPTANQTTNPATATEPTVPASGLMFSSVTSTSMGLSWVNGNGSSRMVIVRPSSPVNALPIDNNSYTANSFFGAGSETGTGNYVVYSGSGNTVLITGLLASTTYHFAVVEFNGSGVTSNYLTSTYPTANQTTNAATASEPTVAASGLSFSSVTSSSMTLTWTNGNGSNRMVIVKSASAVNGLPVDNNSYTANAQFGSGTQIGTGNYVVYSGTGNSVSITGLSASTAYHFAVVEFNGSGVTSNYLTSTYPTANQTTNAAASITLQPNDVYVCVNNPAMFSITASGTGLSYQWQQKVGAGSFTNLSEGGVFSGTTTSQLSISSASFTLNGNQYRCVVSGTIISETATLYIGDTPPSISNSTSSVTQCVGTNTTFTVNPTGSYLSYQWQVNNGDGNYSSVNDGSTYTGSNSTSLTVNNIQQNMSGYKYRCAVSGPCGATVYSSDFTIFVMGIIYSHPNNQNICSGANSLFGVSVIGHSNAIYQWQVDMGSGYVNLLNTAPYSGVNTENLQLSTSTSDMNGYKFRCYITSVASCFPAVYSSEATLNVNPSPSIIGQPEDKSICSGNSTSFTVSANHANNYQWQVSTGGAFTNLSNNATYSGVNSATLQVANAGTSMNGYKYRCITYGSCLPNQTSAQATLTVSSGSVNISGHPSNKTAEAGSSVTFEVIASGPDVTYQWQVNSGSGFINLTNGAGYSGATTNTLTISSVSQSMSGYSYRCIVSGTCALTVNSNSATLSVTNPVGLPVNYNKISSLYGNFLAPLDDHDNFGYSVASIGDINNDGIIDLCVSATGDDDGSGQSDSKGAIYILFMDSDGTVMSHQKISEGTGGFTDVVQPGNSKGQSVINIGDLDHDGVTDLAMSSSLYSVENPQGGAVWILFMNQNGTVKSHSRISKNTSSFTGKIFDYDQFGFTMAPLGDLDGDGNPDIAVTSLFNMDGSARTGCVWILFLNSNGTVKASQKINASNGGFQHTLNQNHLFGIGLGNIGDFDGDGVVDLAVGASGDEEQPQFTGNPSVKSGAIFLLYLNSNGTVKGSSKLLPDPNVLGTNAALFGRSVISVGDIDGDNIADLLVKASPYTGSILDNDQTFLLKMNADASIKSAVRIGKGSNFTGNLDVDDYFGESFALIQNPYLENKFMVAFGASMDDDGGENRGAVWIVELSKVPGVITSNNSSTDGFNIRIFPNPASNLINVDITEERGVATIELFNSLGIIERNIIVGENDIIQLDVEELGSGVYVLVFKNKDGKQYKRKFVKN
ncbi:MAG: immunoglobulin domain-containing protein [Cytophagaceae bacterium]